MLRQMSFFFENMKVKLLLNAIFYPWE